VWEEIRELAIAKCCCFQNPRYLDISAGITHKAGLPFIKGISMAFFSLIVALCNQAIGKEFPLCSYVATKYILLHGKVFISSGKENAGRGKSEKVSVEIAIARKSKNFQRGKTSSTSPQNQVKLKSVKSLNKQQETREEIRCM